MLPCNCSSFLNLNATDQTSRYIFAVCTCVDIQANVIHLETQFPKIRWLQRAGGGMAPAGLLKRALAVDGSSWGEKKGSLQARSTRRFFLIEFHQIGWENPWTQRRNYLVSIPGCTFMIHFLDRYFFGFHDLCVSQMASRVNQHTLVV